MRYFLNRPLILEQVIAHAFSSYFAALKVQALYKNWTINVTNEHPFSLMLPSFAYNASSFPCVVISTETDSKPAELTNLYHTDALMLEKPDVALLKDAGYLVCDELIIELEQAFLHKQILYGITTVMRRQEKISIEIWCENIQLKNELYELCRLFIGGGLRDSLQKYKENNNLVIFDHTLTGQRSGNFNYDFGVTLAGARLTFDADYYIEQSLVDTDLDGKEHITWEIKDYVKHSQG